MDIFFLASTTFSNSILAGKHHAAASSSASICALSLSLKPQSSESDNSSTSSSSLSGNIRRPNTHLKSVKSSPSKHPPAKPEFSTNPLKTLVNPANNPSASSSSPCLTTKLRLSSKLSPPLPAPSPPSFPPEERGNRILGNSVTNEPPGVEFRQQGKIFVGNLPLWIKKHELAEFFRQFGPIKNAILIKGHNETERNMGFGFVICDGAPAEKAAMKAVEFDGVEFHGRVLTVKLDDGRRMKERSDERQRWVEGAEEVEYKSKWHEERDRLRREFRKVLETQPENWQAVVRAFQRVE